MKFRSARPVRASSFACALLLTFTTAAALPTTMPGAAFTPGDLVVYRVGSGTGTLVNTGNPVFLDEYTPAGALVQSIALPTTAAGTNAPLIASGTATSEGLLNLSADGRFLTLTGYAATPGGGTSLPGTASATVPRVVGRADASGTVDTSTRLTDYADGNNPRGAVSTDGASLWITGGSGGVRYATAGGTTSTQLSTTVTNLRAVNLAAGQLTVSTASGSFRIATVGSGTPTTAGQTITNLPGFPTTGSPYAFAFAALAPGAVSVDTLYVADDTANSVQKYALANGAWTLRGAITATGARGLTLAVNSGVVSLYVTTGGSAAAGGGTLYAYTDSTGYNGTVSGTATTIATAPANTAFRGVAFAPTSGTAATAPTGTGAAMPNVANLGDTTLLTVSVTPAANPPSTGLSVTADLSAIGGSATQPFYDDNTNGDAQAGDDVFSFRAQVTAGSGPVNLPVALRDAQGRTGSAAIPLTVSAPPPLSRIHDVQGQTETPRTGMFRVEGVVTATFPNLNPAGFYVQEEDVNADTDPLTSEAIFVNSASFPQVGQKVQVQGTVANTNGLTQFTAGASFSLPAGGSLFPLPAAVTPVLPAPATTNGTPYLERLEGMRVVFPGALYATDLFNLGRFGEVQLSVNDRLFIPTNTIDPDDTPANGTATTGNINVPAVTAAEDLNQRSQFILDDASDFRPNPIPYLRDGGPGGGRTLRVGDSVRNLAGIFTYGFSSYRVQPTNLPLTFDATNPRPAAPEPVGGNVTVAESNVLNYFNTFGGPNDRGADSIAELDRQRAKLVAVLTGLDADIVGLTELENNGSGTGSAVNDLVNTPGLGLNAVQAAAGKATYAILRPPAEPFGSDAIQVGFLYKPSRVTPVGPAVTDNANFAVYNRPPLAQLFSVNATGGSFYVTINHFKSKGGTGATGLDADQGDGQSLFNDRRRQQSTALVSFLNGLAVNDPDILVIGDLNAYGEEDPIDVFRAAGYVDLIGTRAGKGAQPYSFSFNGELGRLDHALATPSLNGQVTGAVEWHVNADEPRIIDYNLDTDDQTNPPPKPDDEYVANSYRASDHDPLLVGLQVGASPLTLSPAYGRTGSTVSISGPNVGAATAVRFAGDAAATFTRDSATQVTATVPAGATTGPIQVVLGNNGGTLVSPTFRLLPRITGFSPASGPVGSIVTINGSGFREVTAVVFANGVNATFQPVSDTQITATVPAGATRGTLRVESPGGAAVSATKFNVTP